MHLFKELSLDVLNLSAFGERFSMTRSEYSCFLV